MFGQNSKEIFIGAFLVYGPIVLLFISQTTAIPFARETFPWAKPCTNRITSTRSQRGSDQNNIVYLVEKTKDAYFLAKYIENTIRTHFNDPEIINFLRNKNLEGFPKSAELEIPEKADIMKMLIDHYSQLSRVAVFLDYIYHQVMDMDLKFDVKQLLFSNLSQMCEIQLAFEIKNQPQEFPVADRSIIPRTIQRSRSTFMRFENTLIVVLKYVELLDFHLSRYENEIGF